jgi:xylulokinase
MRVRAEKQMKPYIVGIDIGTSACKVAVFDRHGTVKAKASRGYNISYPHAGWAEQNPDDWWNAVCGALKELFSQSAVTPEEIAGIGVDGQSWAVVPVGHDGSVLADTPLWMDTRSQALCRRYREKIGEDNIFRLSGNSLQPTYGTGKLLWYREEMPDMYQKIDKVLQANGYIVYRFTGEFTQDMSQGYGFHFFDIHTGNWDEEMCGKFGIPRRFLPETYPCHAVVGTVTKKASEESGLLQGTPVVAGGLDAACGALGTGVLQAGDTQEQGGQAGGMSVCIDQVRSDPRLILSCHVVPGKWLLQGGTVGGGGVMRWLEQEFGAYEREMEKKTGIGSFELLNQLAEEVPPGSDGMVFLPYMAGERSPIWNPSAKGVFYGLDYGKGTGHMLRAAMEGVAMSLRHNLEIAEKAGAKVEILRAMGGSANSILWTQIKADVTGKAIQVPSSDTATTLGAAILAGVGVGVYGDFEEAVKATVINRRFHTPNPNDRSIYDHNYEIYLKLYENLKELMTQEGEQK